MGLISSPLARKHGCELKRRSITTETGPAKKFRRRRGCILLVANLSYWPLPRPHCTLHFGRHLALRHNGAALHASDSGHVGGAVVAGRALGIQPRGTGALLWCQVRPE